jgi:hypothetical protein
MVEPHGGLLRIWRSNGKKDELHKRTETEGPYVKRSEGLFHSVEYLPKTFQISIQDWRIRGTESSAVFDIFESPLFS